jgi:hypothetical protein
MDAIPFDPFGFVGALPRPVRLARARTVGSPYQVRMRVLRGGEG